MTHWITRIHEINRSCVDVKGKKETGPTARPKNKVSHQTQRPGLE